jgi:hypothetical protein
MMKLNTMKSPAVALAVALTCFWAFGAVHADAAGVALTQEAQAAITPAKALEMLKQGNERFVRGKMKKRDLLAQVKQTSKGQFPFAAIVSCLDSRTQPEYVFDQGIGDIFVARVAGNFVNDDILGSLEFATNGPTRVADGDTSQHQSGRNFGARGIHAQNLEER